MGRLNATSGSQIGYGMTPIALVLEGNLPCDRLPINISNEACARIPLNLSLLF